MQRVTITVYADGRPEWEMDLRGPLDIGRRDRGEPPPYQRAGKKLIIAGSDETGISRDQARLALCPNGNVRVTNKSALRRIESDQGIVLDKDQTHEFVVPVRLDLGTRAIQIDSSSESLSEPGLQTLATPTLAPGQVEYPPSLLDFIDEVGVAEHAERMIKWFQSAAGVFQSVATSRDFFQKAAQSVGSLVSLDFAAVLSWNGQVWCQQALYVTDQAPTDSFQFSDTILNSVRLEKRTFRQLPTVDEGESGPASLVGIKALVAAPILDRNGDVIGAIYGDRRMEVGSGRDDGISELEAMLVEMLASAVAAGIARLEEEQNAVQARVQFEQFFTPQLAERLEADRDLLNGREANITVLFCDIRGFSRISHENGARQTVAWTSDVMATLSDCVSENQGVLVDYIGDELMAMWGAPDECERHAELACRAALDMLDRLEALNQKWLEQIGSETDIAIGINSGTAFVGNTGSDRKFKYGPLGNTVNVASRIQGATKHVKVRLLVSDATKSGLPADSTEIICRRLCQVTLVNIREPVTLYEVVANPPQAWTTLRERYEHGLDSFEKGQLAIAARVLGNLLADYPDDGPTLRLLQRSVNALASGPGEDHTVWNLESK